MNKNQRKLDALDLQKAINKEVQNNLRELVIKRKPKVEKIKFKIKFKG